ncbi:N-acetylglucosamine kinase [Burkholderia vietnamiensis]|uniref:N-acetylglucosamine kinase n=1 Tax=Burkholderia vietnamiensis TaxID=60552 RepID=UPI001B914091|nr:BadF/BadG/BcrA/BcrD ATPase family protein [Burkholderia vietnamiensis]MBR8215522.1 N-acetylglucosamine kinase [Burkholderia vietnamiensis]
MTPLFLGIDGGGTKTAFMVIDRQGRVRARHETTTSYYLEIGMDALRTLLADGVHAVLAAANVGRDDVTYAFAGLPAYGEDSRLLPELDGLLAPLFARERYRIGNDMVCSWAGTLAGGDGISIVAGTGSIAYGQREGRAARCGGWGEVFGDEGSAYWIAREGLAAFSRMADGRAARGPLFDIVRAHFALEHDLDLCAAVNAGAVRSRFAQLSRLVIDAAHAGDPAAHALIDRATDELAQLAAGVARALGWPPGEPLPVSYSGGVFNAGARVLEPLRDALARRVPDAVLTAPRLGPHVGAAVHAARLAVMPLDAPALHALQPGQGF